MKPRLLQILLGACLATVVACGSHALTSSIQSVTGENSGDPLRFIFRDAKVSAAKKVTQFKPDLLRLDVERNEISGVNVDKVNAFMQSNEANLAAEIAIMAHDWGDGNPGQQSCAQTGSNRGDPIVFSYARCKALDTDAAERLLIHEAVHHFGIHNSSAEEEFADEVATAVTGVALNADPDHLMLNGFYLGNGNLGGISVQFNFDESCDTFKGTIGLVFGEGTVKVESIDCGAPVFMVDDKDVDETTARAASENHIVDIESKAHILVRLNGIKPVKEAGARIEGDDTPLFEGYALMNWNDKCVDALRDLMSQLDSRVVAGDCGEPSEIKTTEPAEYGGTQNHYRYVSQMRLWKLP